MPHPHHHKTPALFPSTIRIETFSDGVMAIIITIMVLELKVPELSESFSHQAFWQAFHNLWPKLLAYAMSFTIVAIFWVNHHAFFHMLKHSDGKLLWYNNLLLFWLSLVPFATSFLGEHPTAPEACMLFGFVLLCCGLAFPLMGYYAMFKTTLTQDEISLERRRFILRRSIPGSIAYILAIAIAPFSIWITWVIFFLVPLYYFMPWNVEATNQP